MVETKKTKFRKNLIEWGEENFRSFPWRRENDPFKVLVAELMLQKTKASEVEKIYEKFVSKFPTPGSVLESKESDIKAFFAKIGLQRLRTQRLIRSCEKIQNEGQLPPKKDFLENLPGIGKYSTNAILCFAFDVKRPLIDANITRIYGRVFEGKTNEGMYWRKGDWEKIEELLPDEEYQEFNYALIDLGALICTANNPLCGNCPLSQICLYFEESNKEEGD